MSSQDLRFHAILKKGPYVSLPESAFVRIDDVLGQHYFAMPVLSATSLASEHPEFESDGLYGIWILKENLLTFESVANDFSLLFADDNVFASEYRGVEGHFRRHFWFPFWAEKVFWRI